VIRWLSGANRIRWLYNIEEDEYFSGSLSMSERAYREDRDTKSKVKTIIGVSILGFIILLIGVGLLNAGLTWQHCSGGFLGFGETCIPTINYSLLAVGSIFTVFSAPIFLLAWKTYKRPEATITIRDMRQAIMVHCAHCNSLIPQTSLACSKCGSTQRR